jgi:DNA-binding winged helix-turn-helix (wHTH) protein
MRTAIESTIVPSALVQSPWVYVFGPFRLDPARRMLVYGSEVVPLPQRLLELLLVLVRANGAIVSRETLYSLIWPEGGVADSNLSQHIYMLRRALGERAGDRLYIATIHDQGFRFVAPISVVHPAQDLTSAVADRGEPPGERFAPSLRIIHAYSRGCRLLECGMARHLNAAAEHFGLIVRNDPEYAPGLIGLARAHLLLAQNGYSPASYEFPKAKDAIIRALQLDPTSAVAHAVLSNITLFCDWNWREAKRELDTAVRLDSKDITVRASAVWLLAWIGQPGKALLEMQRAVMTEPASPGLHFLLGRVLIDTGDYKGAIEHLSDVMETVPDHSRTARLYRAEALLLAGQPADAILDLLFLPQDRAEDLAFRVPLLALAYATNGDTERAQEAYDALISMKHTDHIAFSNLIPIALALGLRSQALDHLERALELREPKLPLLRHSPWLNSIRRSDLFKSLLAAIGPVVTSDGP